VTDDLLLADVSRWQGQVDWAAYAEFSPAAICKATGGDHDSGGTSRVDPRFRENRTGMRKHLALRGYYHFLQIGADPLAQARHFADTVGELLPGEFAALDVEGDANHAAHERFCAEVDRLVGGVCWLYGGSQVRSSRPVWVARYFDYTADPAGEPKVPHVLWQYTDRGRAPGITGNCDMNVHRGDLASLARFAVRPDEEDDMTADEVRAAVQAEIAEACGSSGPIYRLYHALMYGKFPGHTGTDPARTGLNELRERIDGLIAAGGGTVGDASGEYEIVVRRKEA